MKGYIQPSAAATDAAGRPLVAVLPPEPDRNNPSATRCAEELYSQLIAVFAHGQTCAAIAGRCSSLYAGAATDVVQLGGSIGAQFVLWGALAGTADSLSAALSLTQTVDGRVLWTNTLPVDVHHPQRACATALAQIAPIVSSAMARQRETLPQETLSAWAIAELAEEAIALHPINRGSILDAIRLATKALEKNPRLALAYATRGVARLTLWALGWDDDRIGAPQRADEDTRKALELAPTDPTVIYDRAYVLASTRGPRRAIPLLRRMVELNPGSAQGRAHLGYQLAISGEPEGGLELIREAQALAPNDPRQYLWHWWAGMTLLRLQHFDEAVASIEASIHVHSHFVPVWLTYVLFLSFRGDIEGARRAMHELKRVDPDLTLERVRTLLESEYHEGRRDPPDLLLDFLARAGLESTPTTQ